MEVKFKQLEFHMSGKTGKYIHILLDISPSMRDIDICPRPKIEVAKDTIIAYADRFIALNPSENFIGLSTFCKNYFYMGFFSGINDIKRLHSILSNIETCSWTALYYAMVESIKDIKRNLEIIKDKVRGSALIVITDGMDNSSEEKGVNLENLKEAINQAKNEFMENFNVFFRVFVIGVGVEGIEQLKKLYRIIDRGIDIENVDLLYQAISTCIADLNRNSI